MAKNEALATQTGGSTGNHLLSTEEIALRAHEIFLERGATPGHDMDDWLQAEMELSQKRSNGRPSPAAKNR
jgi:hypothetical protein